MSKTGIRIADYTYDLPEDRIAKHPLLQRDESKLLVYPKNGITEDRFLNLADYLPPSSLLILNNTKVVEARLRFEKPSGAFIEIFCLEPANNIEMTQAMNVRGSTVWKCLIGGASKWKHGQVLTMKVSNAGDELELEARYIDKQSESFLIQLSWTPEALTFAEVLHAAGGIPLPPYIKRTPEADDQERYQTVYANPPGSVAAPTAGLHFTDKVFKKLRDKSIVPEYVTLHVGAGTFKPVKSETIDQHDMHSEFIEVSVETIQQLISRANDQLICVGTTSLRTVESLYWIGVKIISDESIEIEDLALEQWYPYEIVSNYSKEEALGALLQWMVSRKLSRLITKTKIIVTPGYKFRMTDILITNFHQPQSTLLLLIAAFIGEDWKNVYAFALENQYRFLSYGDACLFFRQ